MRFTYGEPPTDPAFSPEADGWTPLKEPSARKLALVGSGVGIPLALLVGLAWSRWASTQGFHLNLYPLGAAGRVVVPLLMLMAPILGFALLTFVHELCHALACPRWGLSRDTVMGAWPTKLLFYAGHLRAVSRRRYLVLCVMPFAMLSLLPLAWAIAWGPVSLGWAALSIMNALVCGGDALIIFLVASQVPSRALIQNKGWSTWWKADEGGLS